MIDSKYQTGWACFYLQQSYSGFDQDFAANAKTNKLQPMSLGCSRF